jgi:hypothetical protein
MSLLLRISGLLALLVFSAGISPAATPKEIKEAIKKGTNALKQYNYASLEIGRTALAGIAMLESEEVPITDPALKAVTDNVRGNAWSQSKTYELSLCLMYLDRLGDPVDDILIQILGVRLLAGQVPSGGWNYGCIAEPQKKEVDELRAIKPVNQPGPPRLHPEVEKYHQKLYSNRLQQQRDDNSNTQFAVIAVWLAQKHGVPAEAAFQLIETHFLTGQGGSGGWAYEGASQAMIDSSSPSMICAGLIGLSTSIARRQERRAKTETPKKEEPPKKEVATEPKKTTPDDPFFNPPQVASKPKPEAKKFEYRKDEKDEAVARAFTLLGQVVGASNQAGRGALILEGGGVAGKHGFHDLYFYWSLERVCVIYGVEKVGGVDWYEAGAHTLVARQGANGLWSVGGSFGAEVNTSFAVLFLLRSNLARDLSGRVQNKLDTIMTNRERPNSTSPSPNPKTPAPGSENPNKVPVVPVPTGAASEAATLAFKLIKSESDKEFAANLKILHDSKGSNFTEALITAANRLDGDRLKQTRQTLADRMTRMAPETLRSAAKYSAQYDEPELRRAAVLAMAQKDDKKFIPDLIEAILDEEDIVVRAAKAGLKSLTNQDFGPENNASVGEKKISKDQWQSWWDKQKK